MSEAALARIGRRRRVRAASAVVQAALLAFEKRLFGATLSRSVLFAERDRIVRELRVFLASALYARLSALPAAAMRTGARAAPFEAIVLDGQGGRWGIALRRLPRHAGRLATYQRVRTVALRHGLAGAVLYDWCGGTSRVLPASASIPPGRSARFRSAA